MVIRLLRFHIAATIVAVLVPTFPYLSAQNTPTHHPVETKHYCHPNPGFCFRYPTSWTMLGDIFAGNGVVIAPEQKGDREQWDEITVALVAPAPEEGEAPGLNRVIDQATSAMREAGQSFQMLQRQERTIDHNPAQVLTTRYRDNATGREWLEELNFIQGPDNAIYSVALKCAPEHLSRLQPAMKAVLASWALPQPQPAAETSPENIPGQSAPAPPSSAAEPAQHP